MTDIFNSSFLESQFPSTWKKANITGIYKNKGSKSKLSNYRPISVLPVLDRTFEKLIALQMY